MTATPVIEGRNIVRDYHVAGGIFTKARTVHAVKDVSFKVDKGRTLAIVGESGCGKSTLARIITLIDPATSGDLLIEGQKVDIARQRLTPEMRRKVQIVFQNPYGSLNPRQKIGDVLAEPLVINTDVPASERRDRAMAMLKKVGLGPEHYNRYPHMFSGGQRQRIAIARALMLRPSLLVLDEPVSALDLSVQAQVLNLLADLQDEFHLTYVFISHDLSVVRYIADDVMVMYFGEAVEYGSRDAVRPAAPLYEDAVCRDAACRRREHPGEVGPQAGGVARRGAGAVSSRLWRCRGRRAGTAGARPARPGAATAAA